MKKIKEYGYNIILGILFFGIASCGKESNREDKVSTIISQIDDPIALMNVVLGDIIEKSGVNDDALPFTQKMLFDFFISDSLTGVDYEVDVQVVVGGGTKFVPNFYGIFKLKDEAAFVDLLEAEANAKVEERDGFKYVVKSSDMYVIVWNDEFAIASNIPMSMSSMMGGSGSKEGEKTVDKLIEFINAADEEPNTTYTDFLKNDSDIGLRVIGEGLYTYLLGMSMGEEAELEKNRELIEGSNGDLFIKFNSGNINLQILSQLSEKMLAQMNMWNDSPLNSKFLTLGASAEPIFSMGQSIDIDKFVEEAQAESPMFDTRDIEKGLEKMGLTLDDVQEALDGDVFFVLDRLDVKEEVIDWGYGEPYTVYNPNPIFSITAGVKNEDLIQNILAEFDTVSPGLFKNGDAYLACANNVFFTSNDSVWASNFLAGKTVKIADEEAVYTEKPFGLFLDFAKVAKMPDMGDEKVLIELMKYAKGSGNVDEFNLSFVFKDDSRNALRILTEEISRMAEEKPETEEALKLQRELEEALQ